MSLIIFTKAYLWINVPARPMKNIKNSGVICRNNDLEKLVFSDRKNKNRTAICKKVLNRKEDTYNCEKITTTNKMV